MTIISEETKIAIDNSGKTYNAGELVYHTGEMVEYDGEKYILVRQASPDNILGEDVPCYSAPAVKIGDEVDEDGWCKRYYIVWKVVDGFDGEDGSLACDWDEPYDVQEVQATEYNINSGQFY